MEIHAIIKIQYSSVLTGKEEREKRMHIILCVDDRFGMLFNGRRLSRDSALVKDAVKFCRGEKLWVNEYSDGLFSRYGCSAQICDPDFLKNAGPRDFCFVENSDPAPYREKIAGIILYRWNRRYPADIFFDVSLLEGRNLIERTEFPGSSHEKITREVYR